MAYDTLPLPPHCAMASRDSCPACSCITSLSFPWPPVPLVGWLSHHLVVCTMASRASCPTGCCITSSSAPRPPVPLVRLVVVSHCHLYCDVDVYSCVVVICVFAHCLHCSPSSGLRHHCLQAASLSTSSSICCVAVSSSASRSALLSASSSAVSWLSPIDVCIDVNLFLLQLNSAIVGCKLMPPRNFLQAVGLIAKPNRVYDARPAMMRRPCNQWAPTGINWRGGSHGCSWY
jgi:hypothetical protein